MSGEVVGTIVEVVTLTGVVAVLLLVWRWHTDLKADMKDLKADLGGRMDRIEGRGETRGDALQTDVKDLKADLGGRMDRIEGRIETRVDALQEDVKDLKADLGGRMDRIEGRIETRVDALQADMKDLHGRLTAVEGKIDLLTKGLHIEVSGTEAGA